MTEAEWEASLKAAEQVLALSSGAPDWLRHAIEDALTVAPQLAPTREAAASPPTLSTRTEVP